MLSKSILSTLLYHSVFDYPLTVNEIHRYLISEKAVLPSPLKKEIGLLVKSKKIISNNNLLIPRFQIHDSRFMISFRLRRQKISAEKMIIAKLASNAISMIPWVKMIAVTGALAMENADNNDDIDLMVVTSRNCLWIVRPLAILLVSLFFKRRYPLPNAETNPPADAWSVSDWRAGNQQPIINNNAICLNLWLDESALEIPVDQRNLYTAHELAQMKPVVNKEKTYEKILIQNRWGKKFLANFWQSSLRVPPRRGVAIPLGSFTSFRMTAGNFLNSFLFHLQFIYMKSKMTNERVSLHSAFFHPGNRTDTILGRYDSLRHRYF